MLNSHPIKGSVVALVSFLSTLSSILISQPSNATEYLQTNLVSDGSVPAAFTDKNLVNPWGISYSPTGPFWLSDNGTGVSTLYNGLGKPSSLIVTVPLPTGSTQTSSTPTGQVFNSLNNVFLLDGTHQSLFLFATEDGTISGWNPTTNATNAIVKVDSSKSGSVYKGLAIKNSSATGSFLYATDFSNNKIDVFDQNFNLVSLSGSFVDSSIPQGFAPFNIQNISNQLYVTYAKQDANKTNDVAGAGNGFVDVFDTQGNLIKRLASAGTLNSPWGIALAPASFGQFSNDLLIGNFGDGRINAFDPNTNNFLGQLTDTNGTPISIDGLWGLIPGNGGNAGRINQLFFSAGTNNETGGLFGSLEVAVPEPITTGGAVLALGLGYLYKRKMSSKKS